MQHRPRTVGSRFGRKLAAAALAAAGVAAGSVATASAAPDPYIGFPSFEQPPTSGYTLASSGSTLGACGGLSIGGTARYCWQVLNDVYVVGPSAWKAQHKNQSVDLNAGGPGIISQRIKVTQNANYRITYWLAGNPYVQGLKTGNLNIHFYKNTPTNQFISYKAWNFSFNSTGKTPTNMGWRKVTINFHTPAKTDYIDLGFTSTTYSVLNGGPVIDNVAMVKV